MNKKKCWKNYEESILPSSVPYASVVEVFQTDEEFILFNQMFLADKSWLDLQRALGPY